LQKFLDRSGISLKSLGEIPDKDIEARPLLVLLQSILVAAVNAREVSRPGTAHFEVVVVNGTLSIAIGFRGPGWGRPALEAVEALARPDRCDDLGPSGTAAGAAIERLSARVTACLEPDGFRVVIELPPPAPMLAPGIRS